MAHAKNHDYHVLPPSIWPLLGALAGFIMLFGSVLWMHGSGPWMGLIGLAGVLYVMFGWWAEVVHEGQTGDHTPVVRHRPALWLHPVHHVGSDVLLGLVLDLLQARACIRWGRTARMSTASGRPPGIETFDPWHLPLINTLILLLSGCAATWAHHALVHDNNRRDLVNGLILAIGLGVIFTGCRPMNTATRLWLCGQHLWRLFFMATGFHGFHVIIGTIFLTVCLIRALKGHFTPEQHVGFEAAAWYWHFVDVVWLFLFAAVYVWGQG
jgi:cytochrome c oxidase subunit 3